MLGPLFRLELPCFFKVVVITLFIGLCLLALQQLACCLLVVAALVEREKILVKVQLGRAAAAAAGLWFTVT
jgi:hypothetical protein